jgi:hypothetical protein
MNNANLGIRKYSHTFINAKLHANFAHAYYFIRNFFTRIILSSDKFDLSVDTPAGDIDKLLGLFDRLEKVHPSPERKCLII